MMSSNLRSEPRIALLLQELLHGGVDHDPLGVAQRAHDQPGVELGCGDDGVLDPLVDRGLLRGDESRAHVDAVGAHRQGRDQAAPVGLAAGRHERDLELVGGARQQDHVRHIVLARVTAALEAIDGTASQPIDWALSACRTDVHLWITVTPRPSGRAGPPRLRPAVSTTGTPPSMIART